MSVTLQTTHGPIKLELFVDLVPRTSFNFLALAATGAYDGSGFHRNIPGFMCQGGAPKGSGGKGGESVWGGNFPDEFHPGLVHDVSVRDLWSKLLLVTAGMRLFGRETV